jgi:uncharacterized protein (TIGR00251 family)
MHSGSGKRVYLDIKVHPRSSKKMIQKTGEREYKVWVVSAPEGGKANKEVVDLVASHFHIPPSWVRIAKGEKSRQKIVVLEYG